MDGITIAEDALAYVANEGIERSEDLEQAETLLREQVLSIGGRALALHRSRYKLGYEGSSRSCPCGKRQRFVEYRPKQVPTLLGTRMKRSGMCWSRRGSQATLSLRVAWLNERWDELWVKRPLAA